MGWTPPGGIDVPWWRVLKHRYGGERPPHRLPSHGPLRTGSVLSVAPHSTARHLPQRAHRVVSPSSHRDPPGKTALAAPHGRDRTHPVACRVASGKTPCGQDRTPVAAAHEAGPRPPRVARWGHLARTRPARPYRQRALGRAAPVRLHRPAPSSAPALIARLASKGTLPRGGALRWSDPARLRPISLHRQRGRGEPNPPPVPGGSGAPSGSGHPPPPPAPGRRRPTGPTFPQYAAWSGPAG